MDKICNLFDKLKSTLSNAKECPSCAHVKRIDISWCNKYCPVCGLELNEIIDTNNNETDSRDITEPDLDLCETNEMKKQKLLIEVEEGLNEHPYYKFASGSYRNCTGQKYAKQKTMKSMKSELLQTGLIAPDVFAKELAFCKQRLTEIKRRNLYTFNSNNDHYNIRFGKLIGIEHILALRFYTKYTSLAKVFNDTDSAHASFYWFGRFLFEMVEFAGNALPADERVYMVIDRQILFRDFNLNAMLKRPVYLTRNYKTAKQCVYDSRNHRDCEIVTLVSNARHETRFIEYRRVFEDVTDGVDEDHMEQQLLLFYGYCNNLIIEDIEIWSESQHKFVGFPFEMECLNYWSSLLGDENVFNIKPFVDSKHSDAQHMYKIKEYISSLISLEIDSEEKQQTTIAFTSAGEAEHHDLAKMDERLAFVLKLFHHHRTHKNGVIVLNRISKHLIQDKNCSVHMDQITKLYAHCTLGFYKMK
eukprot:CAMPEP_0197024706 /NCGR_PEP_ID=MMETSP1384-20130603/5212_1 /TAXON_ID=29189 /ORGANISM="Ammonia sp." /LENGTH=472 /DNA_ID=CAMNT_0042453135 /DNA_START=44 /DNA_END=1462 /DNA_ORIENTATION=-